MVSRKISNTNKWLLGYQYKLYCQKEYILENENENLNIVFNFITDLVHSKLC